MNCNWHMYFSRRRRRGHKWRQSKGEDIWRWQVGIYQLLRASGAKIPRDHPNLEYIQRYFDQEPDWEMYIKLRMMVGLME